MKKILSTVLCLCMLLFILPENVFAATMVSKSDISVNADQIGWYQSNAGSTNRGAITLIYEHDYFHAPTESAPTQADYTNEMRIWVHSPMSGYQKSSENPDVDIDVISACWLPTTYPFADFPMWVHAQDFKPIKDLKDGDEANFNSFYGK